MSAVKNCQPEIVNMPSGNSLNSGRGRDFEAIAATVLGRHFGITFLRDHALPIGRPPKSHRFDLVAMRAESPDYVGECKNYSWTETGNAPSAKMAALNEALLYLSLAPRKAYRFVAMPKALHSRRNESLAEYYCRTYTHLLPDVRIIEIDVDSGDVKTYTHGKLIEDPQGDPA